MIFHSYVSLPEGTTWFRQLPLMGGEKITGRPPGPCVLNHIEPYHLIHPSNFPSRILVDLYVMIISNGSKIDH